MTEQMNSEPKANDEHYKKLKELSEKQQAKIAQLMTENSEVISSFSPDEQLKELESGVSSLMESVHSELEKAMADVNQKMKAIQIKN